eukprot:m51a1_g1508 hypothetical protein (110) ;mRNA; f:393367-393786
MATAPKGIAEGTTSLHQRVGGARTCLDAAAAAEAFWGREDDEPVEQRSPSPRVLRRRRADSRASPARTSLSTQLPEGIEQSLRRCGILTVAMPKPVSRTAWESFVQKLR